MSFTVVAAWRPVSAVPSCSAVSVSSGSVGGYIIVHHPLGGSDVPQFSDLHGLVPDVKTREKQNPASQVPSHVPDSK